MRFLTAIPLLMAWIPHVIKAVVLFESVMDPKLSPEEKKAMVLSYLSGVSGKLNLPWGESAIEIISDLIDTVVSVLKWFGQFRGKSDMTAVEVESASVSAQSYSEFANVNAKKAIEHDPELAAFLAKTAK